MELECVLYLYCRSENRELRTVTNHDAIISQCASQRKKRFTHVNNIIFDFFFFALTFFGAETKMVLRNDKWVSGAKLFGYSYSKCSIC